MASIPAAFTVDKAFEILSDFNTEFMLFGIAFAVQFVLVGNPWRKKPSRDKDVQQIDNRHCMTQTLHAAFERGDCKTALRTWHKMRQSIKKMEVSPMLVVQVLESMQRLRKDAASILEEVQGLLAVSKSAACSHFMNELLLPLAKSLDVSLVEGIVNLFSRHCIHPDSTTFEILVRMHFSTRNFNDVRRVDTQLRTEGVKPTNSTSLVLLKAALTESDFDRAQGYITELRSAKLPEAVSQKYLELACRENKFVDALSEIKLPHIQITTELLNTILDECMRVKKLDLTTEVLDLMTQQEIRKNSRTYSRLIRIAGRDHERILQILDEVASGAIFIDNSLMQAVLKASAEIGDLAPVERLSSLLKAGEPSHVPAVLSLIRFYADSGHATKACELYDSFLRPGTGAQDPRWPCLDARTKRSLLAASELCFRSDITRELGGFDGSPSKVCISRSYNDQKTGAVEMLEGEVRIPVAEWNLALETFVEKGDFAQAKELLKNMADKSAADLDSYNIFIKACLRQGNVDAAVDILELLQRNRCTIPNSTTYNDMIYGLLKTGADNTRKKAFSLLDAMKTEELKPSRATLGLLLKTLKPKASNLEINQTMHYLDFWACQVDEALFCNLLETCVRHKKMQLLQRKLHAHYGTENPIKISASHNFGTVIKAFGMVKDVAGAWRCWKDLRMQHVKPTSITIGCMIEAVSTNGDIDGAYELVQSLLEDQETRNQVNAVVFGSIFKGFSRVGHMDKVWAAFTEMQAYNIEPTVMTFNAILDGCTRSGELDKAACLMQDMKSQGIQPNIITLSTMIKGLWANGNIQQAFQFFEEAEKGPAKPDEPLFNIMLDGCLKAGLADEGEMLACKMLDQGFGANAYTLTVLVKMLCGAMRVGKALRLVEAFQAKSHHRLATSVQNLLLQGCHKQQAYELGARACLRMIKDRYFLDSATCQSIIWGLLRVGKHQLAAEVLLSLLKMLVLNAAADSVEESLISAVVKVLLEDGCEHSVAAKSLLDELWTLRPAYSFTKAGDGKMQVKVKSMVKGKETRSSRRACDSPQA